MFQKKPAKKFNFGLPSNRKSVFGSQETEKYQPPSLTDDSKRKSANNDDADQPTEPKRMRATLEADDEEDFLASAGIDIPSSVKESVARPSMSQKAQDEEEEEEEDDPLDAFMADMSAQAKTEKREPKIRRDDFEEEDHIESYVRHMKEKGVAIGKSDASSMVRDENADSDEEVYATAAAVDAQLNYDSDENAMPVKKEIEPLARVDHNAIDYPEIEKCFYEEHADIAALTPERVQELRREMGLRVSGMAPAKPCFSFAHFGFDDHLMSAIIKAGYTEPSSIQKQAIPVAMEGRDIIGIAKTGSGKTAAFVLPMLVHIMDQEELMKGDGPIGLILAPTRELAAQIYQESKKFAKAYGLKVAAVYGGASKMQQFKDLRSGTVEILVATPGRLIDMIKMKATNLRRVSYLVLDEADRMFDLGFEPQVRSICDNVRPDRQTLLFSATFQKRIESLARQVTSDSIRISVGNAGQANEDITQVAVVLEDEMLKWDWLMRRLAGFCVEGSVIIFVSRKDAVSLLAENVGKAGFECGALHGDLMQFEREKVLRDFKANKFNILVATDVAARGLDIKAVKTVINYDAARDIDSHVHRVGRTGRAGEKGTAYSLVTKKEDKFAGDLVRHLESSGQAVPPELMTLAMSNSRFRYSRENGGRRGGRGRGRGQGGRGRGRGGAGDRRGIGSSFMTGSNNEPLPPRSNMGYSRAPPGGPMNFQKATTSAAGAGGLHTVNNPSSHGDYRRSDDRDRYPRSSRWQ